MRPMLEAIPVRVVMNDRVGLVGAARAALSTESRQDREAITRH